MVPAFGLKTIHVERKVILINLIIAKPLTK